MSNKGPKEAVVISEHSASCHKKVCEHLMNQRIEKLNDSLTNKGKRMHNLDNTPSMSVQSYDVSCVFNSSQTKLIADVCSNTSTECNQKSVLKSLKNTFKRKCNSFFGSSKRCAVTFNDNYGFNNEDSNISSPHRRDIMPV